MPVFTSSIEVTADYPTIKPSLNLNFARSRSLDPRITFTRASVGTYVGRDGLIKTAGEDEARFDHDPETLESLGLLIEESRTNTQTNSQPQSGSFTGGGAVLTYNTSTAPNGETEACRIARNGTNSSNSNWLATRSITFNANTMVLSCWAKPQNGNNYFVWSFQNLGGAIVRAGFLLTGDGGTSIITNGNGGHTLQIEKYPDGWYRCIIIGNTQSSGTTTQFLYTASAYNEGTSAIGGSTLVWGFQLEVGTFPTSYIPTSGSAVTRSADVASITGTNFSSWYNQSEGTFIGDWFTNGSVSTQPFLLEASDSGRSIILYMIRSGGQSRVGQSGATVGGDFDLYLGVLADNQKAKLGLAYKKNDAAGVMNGGTLSTDTQTGTITPDRLGIGNIGNVSGSHQPNGCIKRITYYPKRLTDTQLQLLTS
jgi:hypothetical protein